MSASLQQPHQGGNTAAAFAGNVVVCCVTVLWGLLMGCACCAVGSEGKQVVLLSLNPGDRPPRWEGDYCQQGAARAQHANAPGQQTAPACWPCGQGACPTGALESQPSRVGKQHACLGEQARLCAQLSIKGPSTPASECGLPSPTAVRCCPMWPMVITPPPHSRTHIQYLQPNSIIWHHMKCLVVS